MARIPDPTQMQRVSVTGTQAMTGIDLGAVSRATTQAGGQLFALGAEKQAIDTKYAMSKAGNQFLLNKAKLDGSLAEVQWDGTKKVDDYIGDYEKIAKEELERSAAAITDPRAKDAFMQEQLVRVEMGKQNASQLFRAKETDYERSTVESDLAETRDLIITGSPDDQATAVAAAELRIEAAVEAGFYTRESGGEVLRAFKNSAAEGYIRSLAPADRLEALKNPLAENLPADTRAVLEREATAAYQDVQAVEMVDKGIATEGWDRETAMADAEKIKDPVLRQKFESRADYVLAARDRAELEAQVEQFNQYWLPIRKGDMTVADLPKGVLEGLTQPQQQNLIAAQTAAVTPRAVVSDPTTVDLLHNLNAKKQYGALRKAFQTAAENGLLSTSDINTWSKISIDGVVPDEYKSLMLNQRMLINKMTIAGVAKGNRDDVQAQVTEQFDDWYLQQYQISGKVPDDIAVEKKIDQLFMTTRSAPGRIYGTREMRIYEMTPDQITDTRKKMQEGNPALYRRLEVMLGDTISDTDFIEAYERAIKR